MNKERAAYERGVAAAGAFAILALIGLSFGDSTVAVEVRLAKAIEKAMDDVDLYFPNATPTVTP